MKTYQQLFVLGSVLVAACSGERAASSDAGAGGDAIDVGGSLLQAELNRPDLVVPLSSMVFHDECTETRGDACDSCERDKRADNVECSYVCQDAVRTGGPVGTCLDICADRYARDTCGGICDGDQDACSARTLRFVIDGVRNDELLSACEQAVAHDASCGTYNVGTACSVYAQVEREAATDAYLCVSRLDCADPADSCVESLKATDNGTFAADVAASCPDTQLSDSLMEWLRMEAKWLRPEALADVTVCERYCGTAEFETCVSAWWNAVVGL